MCVEPFRGSSVCFSSPTASVCSSLFCMNGGFIPTYAGISQHPFAPPRPFITALTHPYFLHGCRGIKVAWRGWGFVYRCAPRQTLSVWCVVFWALMQRLENVCDGNLRSWGCKRVRLHLKCIIVKIHCDMHVKMETVRCAVTADCFGGRRRKVSSIINNVLPSSFCPSPSSSPPAICSWQLSLSGCLFLCVFTSYICLSTSTHLFLNMSIYTNITGTLFCQSTAWSLMWSVSIRGGCWSGAPEGQRWHHTHRDSFTGTLTFFHCC